MDQQPHSLPPSHIDKNIVQLAKTVESVYGNPWGIIWRNFLAGLMRVVGMAFGYIVIVGLVMLIVVKSGALGYIQGLWKNITQGLITDVQKNLEKSLPQLPGMPADKSGVKPPDMLQQILPQPSLIP